MLREKLIEKNRDAHHQKGFRWRGHEVSRIEGLSDAVFGFAITLLVVSLEVPKTFSELAETMHGFIAFAISFALLFLVWHLQYTFFRRYGLQDLTTEVLNGVLLFVVLFYIYPLKFVWTLVVDGFMHIPGGIHHADGSYEPAVTVAQVPWMMIIFGAGYVAVFLVFVLLYWHAYRQRHALDLNELETFDTREKIEGSSINVIVGVVSILTAYFGGTRYAPLAGLSYLLLAPALTIHGFISGRNRRKVESRHIASQAAADASADSLTYDAQRSS